MTVPPPRGGRALYGGACAGAAVRRSRMPCVAARNAQGRGPAGRRSPGAWERRAGGGAWGRHCGLAPCTGMVTCFTVRESRSKAVADAIKLARSCSQKVPGCTVNKAMGPPPGLERAERAAHGVWTPGAQARTARHNTLIGWTPIRRRLGAPSRTSLTFFGVSPRDAGKGLRQPLKSSRRHHSAAIGITDATLHLLALWKRQQCGRPRKVRRRKSLTATGKQPSSSQRSNRDYRLQHSIRWRFGNAKHIALPQGAEAKAVRQPPGAAVISSCPVSAQKGSFGFPAKWGI